MVQKPNGKWCMCVDLIDLNKMYPKDSFPLSRIITPVDSMASHQTLSFMDSFLGYNQIKMHEFD